MTKKNEKEGEKTKKQKIQSMKLVSVKKRLPLSTDHSFDFEEDRGFFPKEPMSCLLKTQEKYWFSTLNIYRIQA